MPRSVAGIRSLQEEEEAENALSPPFKLIATKESYEVRLYDTYFYVTTAYSRRDEGIATVSS